MNIETKNFIIDHLNDDVSKLALSTKRNAETDLPFALRQIKARQSVKQKLPAWYANHELIFPAQLSVEQSSSEQTAACKSALIGGETLIDLTGGMGIDSAFLSRKFKKTVYVERNAELCETAVHNFAALGLQIEVVNADAAEYLQQMKKVDCIYIDPARRDVQGRKVASFSDCEPNVLMMNFFKKAETILIKTSPMLDISQATKELKNVAEVHIIAVENECKELLFLLKKDFCSEPVVVAVNFPKNAPAQHFSFTFSEEQNALCTFADAPETYLYEPNAALLKAGAFKLIAERFNLQKLHPNSHLYTSKTLCADFQGRIFLVEEYSNKIKNIERANIAVRNYPETADALRRKLRIADGGGIYIFATTLCSGQRVLIRCRSRFS